MGEMPPDKHSRAQLLSLSLERSGVTVVFPAPKQSPSDAPRRWVCMLNSVMVLVEEDEPHGSLLDKWGRPQRKVSSPSSSG